MAEVAMERIEHDGSAGDATLASGISSGDTTITLEAGHGWSLSGGTGKFWIRIDSETILCSALSTNTLTADARGADDTTAAAHTAGATVQHVFAAKEADEANQVANRFDSSATLQTAGIKDLNVTRAKIAADAIDGTKIEDDAVDSEHLAAGAIDLEHMSANSVDSDQYVDGSIDKVHLAADIIDGTKIADDAIDSEHYVDGSIDTAHLAADAVTGAKIADDQIDSEHYVAGSIDNEHLADDAVDSDELAAGAVDYAHLAIGPQQGAHELTNNVNPAETPGEIWGTADVISDPSGAVTLTATCIGYFHSTGGAGTNLEVQISDDGGSTWTAADYSESESVNVAASYNPRASCAAHAFYSGTPSGDIHIRAWLIDLGGRSGNLTATNGGITWTLLPA